MLRTSLILLLTALTFHGARLYAQVQPETAVADSGIRAMNNAPSESKSASGVHRFWDTENICLFAGVGGARLLDYASTRHLRNQGNNEWLLTNTIVDNRPLFVGIELAGTAASMGVSYLFHYTGHHCLERWTSIVHIGVGVGGSIRNYRLKPPEPLAYSRANVPLVVAQSGRSCGVRKMRLP